ncbi:hypothetical protein SCHIN_v1c05210 [Spiroplasma chinense]|uniref:Uncharacterized protein n=1 Tax=Spiroplasma chinense TaxID=216932 RepID=A0A5B9Y3J3_9MOLU|nr:hypothetical protein [Spiroplasma chinense]QEH61718.1 hypothetical protein SCHIN_v1c05210 [Spiroplasma chinense]
MGLFRSTKQIFRILRDTNDNRALERQRNIDKVYQLVLNNEIQNINIRNITTMNQKFNALVFKDKLNYYLGYRFINLKGFNSFGFKDDVDLIFCDKKYQVIETYSNFKPNKVTEYFKNGAVVYVLAKNMNKYLDIKIKDIIKISK